jgi:hypothetical protein
VASYWLSYLSCRCTRSVSLPVPLHYARLAAARGQCLVTGDPAAGQEQSLAPLHPKLAASMFFA